MSRTGTVTPPVLPDGARTDVGAQHYADLRRDVLDGAFEPDDLLQESTLAARYRVSRTPVREALARLEQDGLLERAPRGYRVRSGSPEDVLDIYDARTALEGVAAASAAGRRTELELARLAALHTGTEHAAPDEQRRLNLLWHEALWAAGHNATVTALLHRLTAQLRIYDGTRTEHADDLAEIRAEHAAVLDALRVRDAEAARAAVAAHLQRSRDLRLHAFAARR
ncbi:MAG TPA: GntR family transcriptional regulator [Cellulomonas sp.]